MSKSRRLLLVILLPLYGACSATYLSSSGQVGNQSWQTASREPAGLAPDPATTPEAVVQVYAARTVRWRGYFGVHTWIAVKPSNAKEFTIYEVARGQLRRTGSSVRTIVRAADARWFGAMPELLKDVRGPGVEAMITRIKDAAHAYPYADTYRVWPGPNSNTFVAYVLRAVPELRVDLPPTAIGKDYLGGMPVAYMPSGTGGQVNLLGVAGIAASWEEGLELNLLGLTFGIDPNSFALKLPMIGRIGPDRDIAPVMFESAEEAVVAASGAVPAVAR